MYIVNFCFLCVLFFPTSNNVNWIKKVNAAKMDSSFKHRWPFTEVQGYIIVHIVASLILTFVFTSNNEHLIIISQNYWGFGFYFLWSFYLRKGSFNFLLEYIEQDASLLRYLNNNLRPVRNIRMTLAPTSPFPSSSVADQTIFLILLTWIKLPHLIRWCSWLIFFFILELQLRHLRQLRLLVGFDPLLHPDCQRRPATPLFLILVLQ